MLVNITRIFGVGQVLILILVGPAIRIGTLAHFGLEHISGKLRQEIKLEKVVGVKPGALQFMGYRMHQLW